MSNSSKFPPALLILIVFSLVVDFSGCNRGNGGGRPASPPPRDDNIMAMPGPTEIPTVNIYLDITTSMQGYINPGQNSRYVQVLQGLEDAVSEAFGSLETLRFFEFGTFTHSISRGEYRQRLEYGSYYTERGRRAIEAGQPGITLITRIDTVLAETMAKHLTIVITDLFQDDADMNRVFNALRTKFQRSKQEFTVGVMGLQSDYNGIIYDVPGLDAIPHNDIRPYYLLLMGRQADVLRLIETLDDGLNTVVQPMDSLHCTVIAPFIDRMIATFPANMRLNSRDRSPDFIPIGGGLWNDRMIPHFEMRTQSDTVWFNFRLKRTPFSLNYPMMLTISQGQDIDLSSSVYYYVQTTDSSGTVSGRWENPFISREKIMITIDSLTHETIEGKISLDPTVFEKGPYYSIRIKGKINVNGITLPNWVTQWNLDRNHLSNSEEFHLRNLGTKTLNLRPFVTGVINRKVQAKMPRLFDIQFTVQKTR